MTTVDIYVLPVLADGSKVGQRILAGRAPADSTIAVLAPDVEGYVTKANQIDVQVKNSDAEIKLVYMPLDDNQLVVQAASKSGKALGDPVDLGFAATGEHKIVKLPPIAGYNPVDESIEFDVHPGRNSQTTLYEPANDTEVTVKCYDQAKNLIDQEIVHGTTDSMLEITAPDVAGYGPIKSVQNILVKPKDNEVSFKYNPRSDNELTIHFVDEHQHIIAAPKSFTCVTNAVFTFTNPSIEDYEPKDVPTNNLLANVAAVGNLATVPGKVDILKALIKKVGRLIGSTETLNGMPASLKKSITVLKNDVKLV